MIIITITVLIIRSKAFKAMVESIKLHDTVIKWFVSLLLVYKYINTYTVAMLNELVMLKQINQYFKPRNLMIIYNFWNISNVKLLNL